jgi:hypothetical protein
MDSLTPDLAGELQALKEELGRQKRIVDTLVELLALPSGSVEFADKLRVLLAERDRTDKPEDDFL